MSFNSTLISFLLVAASFTSAKADVFFEPSVGYRSESLKLTGKTMPDTKATMGTPVFGAKLGVRTALGVDINLAADYSTGKAEITPLTEKNTFSHRTIAAQLGISAMGVMKIYLGYGFSNELTINEGLLNSDMKLNGPAYQAGLQFRFLPWLNVGAQYSLNQFRTIEGKNYTTGDSIDQYYGKVDSQDYSFTLSMDF